MGAGFAFPHRIYDSVGAPFHLIDSGRPTLGLPAPYAALAARRRSAVSAKAPLLRGPRIAALLRKRSAAPHRGPRKTAGAPEMERPESIPSGPPPRSRRGREPCSPVNPFFGDGGISAFFARYSYSRRRSAVSQNPPHGGGFCFFSPQKLCFCGGPNHFIGSALRVPLRLPEWRDQQNRHHQGIDHIQRIRDPIVPRETHLRVSQRDQQECGSKDQHHTANHSGCFFTHKTSPLTVS